MTRGRGVNPGDSRVQLSLVLVNRPPPPRLQLKVPPPDPNSDLWPVGEQMFNLFNLRRPSDFKKEKHNGEERGDVKNFQQQMFSKDVCFSPSDLSASRDLVNRHEIRGLAGKRPRGIKQKQKNGRQL